jgi:uncharacterized RDD family membrane protein YckC
MAKGIDLFLIFILSLILPHPLGVFLGLGYVLLHDGISGGQSLGKRLLKSRVVLTYGPDQNKVCDYKRSAVRNAPLAVATFFAIIPFWGWILALVLGLPMVAIEIYLMATRPGGDRLGDLMADTKVVHAVE